MEDSMIESRMLSIVVLLAIAGSAAGQITYTPTTPLLAAGASPGLTNNWPHAVVAADFDGDGRDEIFVMGHPVVYHDATGAGLSFATQTYSIAADARPTYATAADMDSDGLLDLVYMNFNGFERQLEVLWNAGGGSFTGPTSIASSSSALGLRAHFWFEVIDMDGDGDTDVVVADRNGAMDAQWYENDGSGQLSMAHDIVGVGFVDLRAADINGDGDVDLIGHISGASATLPNHLAISINNSGVFGLPFSTGVSSSNGSAWNRRIELSDFDGDGDLDIYFAARFLVNTGFGTFVQNAVQISPPNVTIGGAWTAFPDADGDGDLDAIWGSGGVRSLESNGSLGFFDLRFDIAPVCGEVASQYSVAAGDFDGDGDVDLAYEVSPSAQCSTGSILIARNDTQQSAGAFPGTANGDLAMITGVGAPPTPTPTKSIASGDTLVVELTSPGSTLNSAPVLLIAEGFQTGGLYPQGPSMFPELQVSLQGAFFLLDGSEAGGLATSVGPLGLRLNYTVPLGLSGSGLIVQAVALTATFPFFVTADAHEIEFL